MSKKFAVLAAIIVTLYIPLALIDNSHFPFSDGAEHGAAVRGIAENPVHPSDPLLAHHPGNSPRYVPSIYLMGLAMRLLHLDIITTIKIFSIVYFLLFLFAAAVLSREYFRDAGQALWSVLCLLFLWGLGWKGGNAYMYTAIVQTSWYPSVVSFSLAFLALYCQLRFLRGAGLVFFAAAAALGALTFVNHLITGGFFLVCSGLLYLEYWRLRGATFWYYGITVAATVCLTLLWPFYDLIPTVYRVLSGQMGQASDYQLTRSYLTGSQLLVRTGPALCGIMFLGMFLVQKRYFLLIAAFAVFTGIYVSGYFLKPSLIERYGFFVIFTMQMAYARTCREWFCADRSSVTRRAAWALLLLLVTGGITQAYLITEEYLRPSFQRKAGSIMLQYRNPNRLQMELRKYLKPGDVVLSDLYTSWGIPVYTGAKIVGLFHTPTHVRDNPERIADIDAFYDAASDADTRFRILKKYQVTHILLNFPLAGKEIKAAVEAMGFPVVARTASYCLYSVETAAEANSRSPKTRLCVAARDSHPITLKKSTCHQQNS